MAEFEELKVGLIGVFHIVLRRYFCPKHKEAKIFKKHLNPVVLIFMG